MSNHELAKKMAESYARCMKVDTKSEMDKLEETIEDTLTRLEELENGLNMLQAESNKFSSRDFTSARSNIDTLCQRIHKLDEMSKIVLEGVESMEIEVNNAEASLIPNTEGKLKNILRPLMFMNSDAVSPVSSPSTSNFTPRSSFSTSSFFLKQSEEDV